MSHQKRYLIKRYPISSSLKKKESNRLSLPAYLFYGSAPSVKFKMHFHPLIKAIVFSSVPLGELMNTCDFCRIPKIFRPPLPRYIWRSSSTEFIPSRTHLMTIILIHAYMYLVWKREIFPPCASCITWFSWIFHGSALSFLYLSLNDQFETVELCPHLGEDWC